MKAWRVTCGTRGADLGDDRVYVLAETQSKAKAMVYNSEFGDMSWYLDWRAIRVPELDGDELSFYDLWANGLMQMHCKHCRYDMDRRQSSRWFNGFTAHCKNCLHVEPPATLNTIRDFQPYNGPDAVNMIWIGDDS